MVNGNGNSGQNLHYKRKQFIENYEKLCVIGRAAEATGIRRQTVYEWLKTSEAFKEEFESAKQGVVEKLETEAMRRAYDGWDEPVFYRGEQQGLIRKYSDTLLIFMLKGVAPEKYRERVEHTGEGGGPLVSEVKVTVVYENANKRNNGLPAVSTS